MSTISVDRPDTINGSNLPLRLIDGKAIDHKMELKYRAIRESESELLSEKYPHVATIREIYKKDDPNLENDLSSIDSISLTDSPDGTTISTASYKSSQSSLSGSPFRSPDRSSGKASKSYNPENKHGRVSSVDAGMLFFEGKFIKSEYSTLRHQCIKFCGKHNAGKANYLRLTLIPFLRRKKRILLPSSSELELPVKVLKMWWEALLEVAESNFKSINGADRNLFYEAISAIITRPEWFDSQTRLTYQKLLMRTVVHSLVKSISMGSLPAAQAAFTGKVLAYGYFYIPGVAPYLLKLLAISKSAIKRLVKEDWVHERFPLETVPKYLQQLVGACSASCLNEYHIDMSWLPEHLCTNWEKNFKAETPMFASFLKHFCTLQSQYLPIEAQTEQTTVSGDASSTIYTSDICPSNERDTMLLACPGMILVLAHIVTKFDEIVTDSARTIGSRNANPYSFRQNGSTSGKGSARSSICTERIRIDQLKIFGVFREILHYEDATIPYFTVYCNIFDRVVRAVALGTRVHDMDGCVTVCDLAEEWIYSIFAVRSTKSKYLIIGYKHFSLDWEFWINVIKRMLKSDNTHTEIRALSILFNIWPYLPNTQNGPGSDDESILRKITKWIISPDIWIQLFLHWSPLVRSYYHRLLCYRLASIGLEYSSWYLDYESAQILQESRRLLEEMLVYTYNWCRALSTKTRMKPETNPSLPMPHLRVGIRRFGPFPHTQATKSEQCITRIFPFDIFDTAVYWQADTATHTDHSYVEEKISYKPQGRLQRSASKASKCSTESAASLQSNASAASNLSLRSLKNLRERARRLSMIIVNKEQHEEEELRGKVGTEIDETNEYTSKSTEASETAAINDKRKKRESTIISMKARWSLLRKAIPSRKQSSKYEHSDENITTNNTSATIGLSTPPNLTEDRKTKTVNNGGAIFQKPIELTHARPEILRPPHRFVLIPTTAKPPSRSHLRIPKLPFSLEISPESIFFDLESRDPQRDLVAWNYGGRSLAEWNIEVLSFEHFAKEQKKASEETFEMFSMPFLVAEIPWRVTG